MERITDPTGTENPTSTPKPQTLLLSIINFNALLFQYLLWLSLLLNPVPLLITIIGANIISCHCIKISSIQHAGFAPCPLQLPCFISLNSNYSTFRPCFIITTGSWNYPKIRCRRVLIINLVCLGPCHLFQKARIVPVFSGLYNLFTENLSCDQELLIQVPAILLFVHILVWVDTVGRGMQSSELISYILPKYYTWYDWMGS